MSCFWIATIAMYLLFLPPSSPIGPGTAAADIVGYDYYVDDLTPTVELPSKQSPSPLPHIAYLSVLNSCIRHCCCCTLIPTLLHSLSLLPLTIVPTFSYAA